MCYFFCINFQIFAYQIFQCIDQKPEVLEYFLKINVYNFRRDKYVRRVWRYQRGNQSESKRYIKEEQTTQWPKRYQQHNEVIRIRISKRRTDNTMAKRRRQKDKQRSIKHTYKTKDLVTRTPLKTGGELRCSGRVSIALTCMLSSLTLWIYFIWLCFWRI